VIEKQPIEKNLVGVLELAEIDMPLEIVVLTDKGFVGARRLFSNGLHHGREKAIKPEGLALLISKSGAFVQGRRLEEYMSAQMGRELRRK